MVYVTLVLPYINRRRIKTAQSAVFSSRFVTDNHLIRHAKRAVLNVHRFKMCKGVKRRLYSLKSPKAISRIRNAVPLVKGVFISRKVTVT